MDLRSALSSQKEKTGAVLASYPRLEEEESLYCKRPISNYHMRLRESERVNTVCRQLSQDNKAALSHTATEVQQMTLPRGYFLTGGPPSSRVSLHSENIPSSPAGRAFERHCHPDRIVEVSGDYSSLQSNTREASFPFFTSSKRGPTSKVELSAQRQDWQKEYTIPPDMSGNASHHYTSIAISGQALISPESFFRHLETLPARKELEKNAIDQNLSGKSVESGRSKGMTNQIMGGEIKEAIPVEARYNTESEVESLASVKVSVSRVNMDQRTDGEGDRMMEEEGSQGVLPVSYSKTSPLSTYDLQPQESSSVRVLENSKIKSMEKQNKQLYLDSPGAPIRGQYSSKASLSNQLDHNNKPDTSSVDELDDNHVIKTVVDRTSLSSSSRERILIPQSYGLETTIEQVVSSSKLKKSKDVDHLVQPLSTHFEISSDLQVSRPTKSTSNKTKEKYARNTSIIQSPDISKSFANDHVVIDVPDTPSKYIASQPAPLPDSPSEIFANIIKLSKAYDSLPPSLLLSNRIPTILTNIRDKDASLMGLKSLIQSPLYHSASSLLTPAPSPSLNLLSLKDILWVKEIWVKAKEQVKKGLGGDVAVLHEHILEQITWKNILTLEGTGWVNDEVVNGFLRLLDAELERQNYGKKRVVNSHFFDTVVKKGAELSKTLRMLAKKKIDLKSIEQLFVPVNTPQAHWSFLIIDLPCVEIYYCDSLKHSSLPCPEEYVIEFANSLLKDRGQLSSSSMFTKVKRFPDFPRQNNAYDCGVFMLKGIELVSRIGRPAMDQSDAPYLRHQICYELLKGQLLSESQIANYLN